MPPATSATPINFPNQTGNQRVAKLTRVISTPDNLAKPAPITTMLTSVISTQVTIFIFQPSLPSLFIKRYNLAFWCRSSSKSIGPYIITTAHEIRRRARCHNCGVKGNNTYQIVYTGNSDVAMDGAYVSKYNWLSGVRNWENTFSNTTYSDRWWAPPALEECYDLTAKK